MSRTARRLYIGWGAIGFVMAIAAVTGLYLFDTLSVSMNRNNVILVLPLSVLVLLLCVLVVIRNIRFESPDQAQQPEPAPESDTEPGEPEQSPANILRALILLSLLGGYVFTYEWIGFDIATFVFIALSLVLLGHRKPAFVLLYSLIFTLVVIGGAMALLSYPMPMSIL